MDERVYTWYNLTYGLDRDMVDQHLCIAERVRSGYKLAAACAACGLDCEPIADRWGECIEAWLRAHPKHTIFLQMDSEMWYKFVPTIYIDALYRCAEEEEKRRGWWPWILIGGLIGLGLVMLREE